MTPRFGLEGILRPEFAMNAHPAHVAIVGGGPAGALLAYLLARGGVRVTLIERHSDFSREFRGEGMTPSGMAAIREAGLWEEFDGLPATQLKSMALYANGRAFLTLDIDRVLPAGMQFIRILAQPHLLEMLVRKSADYQGFNLLRGVLVREPMVDGGRAYGVRYRDGDGVDRELAADYVIAADGRYSTLRRALGLELAGGQQAFDVVWCKVPRPTGMIKGRVYSFILDDFFGLAFPTEGDQVQIGRIIAKGSYKQFKGDEEGQWYDKIAASLPAELAPGFLAVRSEASNPTLLDVVCGALEKWSMPGICFIGDAAHPMSPVGAQGINIALRDAIVAANSFGPALLAGADGETLDRAAAQFEGERRTEVDKVQSQQTDAMRQLAIGRRMAPIIRFVPDAWIGGLARLMLGRRFVRDFIEGVSDVRLTFGRPRT
jgi:2-polyprenyl-6-methoxyphenol hydroxylase-like FAD-dependent oxidoreductase